MKIVDRPIGELIPYASNPRKNDHAVAAVAGAIREFGFRVPIVAKSDGTIVDGHLRLKAAYTLGLQSVPTISADDMTEAQIKAFRLSVNKLSELAEWDMELLKMELDGLVNEDFDLGIIGFDEEEPSVLMADPIEPGITDPDDVPEVQEAVISKPGDVWLLGGHRLMCGNSLAPEENDRLFEGVEILLVLIDPPYGLNIVAGVLSSVGGGSRKKFKGEAGRNKIVPAKTYGNIVGDENTNTARDFYLLMTAQQVENIVLFGGNYFTDFLPPSKCWIIWDKEMTGNFSQAEMAWTNMEVGGVRIYKFLWNGLEREGSRTDELVKRVHPTQKPVGLFEKIISIYDDAETIYDGFCGSGTTIIAAQKTGRKCYAMEISPHYVDVAVRRWQDYTGEKAMLESSGQAFNELKI